MKAFWQGLVLRLSTSIFEEPGNDSCGKLQDAFIEEPGCIKNRQPSRFVHSGHRTRIESSMDG